MNILLIIVIITLIIIVIITLIIIVYKYEGLGLVVYFTLLFVTIIALSQEKTPEEKQEIECNHYLYESRIATDQNTKDAIVEKYKKNCN